MNGDRKYLFGFGEILVIKHRENMDKEDFLERAEEIFDKISCWNGIEWEALKLFCLFSKCKTTIHEAQEWVHVNYVREKIFNLLIKHPTLLAGDAQRMYAAMRIEKEDANWLEEEEIRDAKDYIRHSAMQMIIDHGGHDGEHHKDWCLDQVFRILAGDQYQSIVDDQKSAGYEWNEGIAP